MAVKSERKSRTLAALGAGLAMIALPGMALAQEHGRGSWRQGGNDNASAQANTGAQQADRGSWRGGAERGSNAGRGNAERGNSGPAWRAQRSEGGERQQPAWRNERQAVRQAPDQAPAVTPERNARRSERVAQQRDWSSSRLRGSGEAYATQERNRTYADPNRNRTYRERSEDRPAWRNPRSETWQQRNDDRRRESWRNESWRNDANRWSNRGNHAWNNNWRRDRRYDWQGYRSTHRHIYRVDPYYAPYRNWSYRRIGIGFTLDSLFFGSSYWIGDPGYYRLPPVHGPYRWVRYFDDVLLVDIYSGEVVDVIYDFFW